MTVSNNKKKTRRRFVRWSAQMRSFVLEYLKSADHMLAYAAAYGKGCESDDEKRHCRNCGRRLLRNPLVMRAVNRHHAEACRQVVTHEWIVDRLVMTYTQADAEGDRAASLKALDQLGKIAGVYEKDNQQRAGTDTAEQIRDRLRARGIDVDRLFPKASQN
jgi:hypothetical protein